MKWTRNQDRSGAAFRLRSRLGLGAFVLLGVVLMAAQQGQQGIRQQTSGGTGAQSQTQSQAQNLDTGDAQRKKQIADECARLLALATDLKTEVDKTNKDTLSLTVIRKAGEIQQLAHSVKERMRLASADH
jgi:hypothetical protein